MLNLLGVNNTGEEGKSLLLGDFKGTAVSDNLNANITH
jgi:hypothetical protein